MRVNKQFFIGILMSVIPFVVATTYYPTDIISRNVIVTVSICTIFVIALLINVDRKGED